MREAIRAVPDGVYESEVWPVSMGKRRRFPVKSRGHREEIDVSYDGSPPELLQGGLNCTFNFTEAKTFFSLKCLLTPHIRSSAGCYRAMSVQAPEGSMLNCQRRRLGWHSPPYRILPRRQPVPRPQRCFPERGTIV